MTFLSALDICREGVEVGLGLGAEDVAVLASLETEKMIKFSNNKILVFQTTDEIEATVYLTKGQRRIVGTTTNIKELRRFVEGLYKKAGLLKPSPDYTPLPAGPFAYRWRSNFSRSVEEAEAELVDKTEEAINSALAEGAKRVAGSLVARVANVVVRTSAGVETEDRGTSITINVRAFLDAEISGHGLSCAYSLERLDAEEAGRTAGRYAAEVKEVGRFEEGVYDVIFSPTVAADLIQYVGYFSSSFYVDTGMSFLKDKVGQRVAVEGLNITDVGIAEDGFGGRAFDDEGYPTQETPIIREGTLVNYLHNSTTSRKYGVASTGNAGFIVPHPWNLIVAPGDVSFDEMVGSVKRGFLVTNNWYTRFQNYLQGEYSTLPRDATFYVENGSVKWRVSGLRISDAMPRQLMNIAAIGEERKWIRWWEVKVPTLAPALLIRDVKVTKALF